MLTCVEGQGTTAKNRWDSKDDLCYDCSDAAYSAKYTTDANCSAIRLNGTGLLDNRLVCEDPYCLNAGSWLEPKITLDEAFANQIAEEVAKKLSKQIDPLEKNLDIDEVEVPPMSGFIEI